MIIAYIIVLLLIALVILVLYSLIVVQKTHGSDHELTPAEIRERVGETYAA
jgi:hypothetical protein